SPQLDVHAGKFAPASPASRWLDRTTVPRQHDSSPAFPPVGIWPLAVIGPALLVVALWQRSLRGSFLVGLVFGLAFFFPLLAWVVNVAWYAYAGLAGADTVLFAVLALGQRLLFRLRPWPVAVGVWWVAAESLRDRWPFGGFPWGRLVMSKDGAPTVN